MGFAASQARLLTLVARRQDLGLQLQFINQARQQLGAEVTQLLGQNINLDPGSPDANKIQYAEALINQSDKRLEILANQINSQLEAVNTEMDAVRKIIDKNIQTSFGLSGSGQ